MSYMSIVMARKKISTTVYMTEEQCEKLKLLNQRTKVPVAEYIRQGIDLVLKLYRHHIPGQMTLDETTTDQNTPPSPTSTSY